MPVGEVPTPNPFSVSREIQTTEPYMLSHFRLSRLTFISVSKTYPHGSIRSGLDRFVEAFGPRCSPRRISGELPHVNATGRLSDFKHYLYGLFGAFEIRE